MTWVILDRDIRSLFLAIWLAIRGYRSIICSTDVAQFLFPRMCTVPCSLVASSVHFIILSFRHFAPFSILRLGLDLGTVYIRAQFPINHPMRYFIMVTRLGTSEVTSRYLLYPNIMFWGTMREYKDGQGQSFSNLIWFDLSSDAHRKVFHKSSSVDITQW